MGCTNINEIEIRPVYVTGYRKAAHAIASELGCVESFGLHQRRNGHGPACRYLCALPLRMVVIQRASRANDVAVVHITGGTQSARAAGIPAHVLVTLYHYLYRCRNGQNSMPPCGLKLNTALGKVVVKVKG